MALTAARTELNVSLVGEDETIRMIEDAKKRMGELEAKTRSLTGATQAQTQAAKAQTEATGGLNARLGRMGEAIAGPLAGFGKFKEGIGKVVEGFGFLGSAVTGAITAFDFLVEAFDDSKEKAAEQERQLAETKKKTDELKLATDGLNSSLALFNSLTGAAGKALADRRVKLAQLKGDTAAAAQEMLNAEAEGAKASAKASESTEKQTQKALQDTTTAELLAKGKVTEAEKNLRKLREKSDLAEEGSRNGIMQSHREAAAERKKQLDYEILQAQNALKPEREALKLATQAREEGERAVALAGEQLRLDNEIANLTVKKAAAGVQPEAAPVKPRGGGGGGGGGKKPPEEDPEEVARREAMLLRAEADEIARVVKALYEEQQAREANEAAMLSATKLMRDEVGTTLPALRQQMMRDLAALPSGELFESIRKQLEEQVKAVDAQMGDLRALANIEDADLLAQATDKQVDALDKLQQSYLNLGEAKAKALEESIKLREELERGEIAGSVNQFSEALQQLGQMQAPVFEVVTESLAGINAQMGKFKEGQQSLTTAIVGSAGAIAGAVGKKIDNVKLEAGIRALFETAMGFATLGNPAESVGHFTAAAMFGLVAGGVIPTTAKSGKDGGGSKAPAKTEAKSRDSMMGGGGGQVTNVYNLQTGIVDGQSTAQAFRRAEMQARNTGMASAGGW